MKKLLIALLFLLPFVSADNCGFPVYVGTDCNFQAFHPQADSADVVKWSLINPDNVAVWSSIDDNGFNADGNFFYLNSGNVLSKPGNWTLIVDFVDIAATQGNTDKKTFTVFRKEPQRYCASDDVDCLEEQGQAVNPDSTEFLYKKQAKKTLILGFIEPSTESIIIGVIVIILLALFIWWRT